MNANQDVTQRVRDFIFRQFPLAQQAGLSEDDSLVESGIIDSMGVLEVVTFLESEFEVVLDDDEVVGDNFESIATLVAFTENKLVCRERA